MNLSDFYRYVSIGHVAAAAKPLIPVLINPSLNEIKWLLFGYSYRVNPDYHSREDQKLRGMIYKQNLYLWPDLWPSQMSQGIPRIWVFERNPTYFMIVFHPDNQEKQNSIEIDTREHGSWAEQEKCGRQLRAHPQIQRIRQELDAAIR